MTMPQLTINGKVVSAPEGATLLEAAGCEPSARCLGRSLVPCLADPTAPLRETALSEVGHSA